MSNYHIFATAAEVVETLAKELEKYSLLNRPVHISLSGGNTPKLLFQRLAQPPYATQVRWSNLHFWWGDERCVAVTDPESNYGTARDLLFRWIVIPKENIHPIRGEHDPHREAVRFALEMAEILPQRHGTPVFDWILLGVGPDGHTASLFPGTTDYQDNRLACVATQPQTGQLRISATAKVLRAAKRISYLALGSAKQAIVNEISRNPAGQLPYPAARIVAENGVTEWYLDREAAPE